MSSGDVQLSQQSLSSLQPQQRGQEGKHHTIGHWRQGLRWTVRLGHCQRKGGRRRIGERGRETAPFVRAGDAPLNTTPFMHAPAAQGKNGVSQSCTWPWPVQLARSQERRAARGGGGVTRIATDAHEQTAMTAWASAV